MRPTKSDKNSELEDNIRHILGYCAYVPQEQKCDHKPCNVQDEAEISGILDLIQSTHIRKEDVVEVIDGLEKWIVYNKHDMGEMGDFIRVKYALNGVAGLRQKLGLGVADKNFGDLSEGGEAKR